jgi:hypothetical protein
MGIQSPIQIDHSVMAVTSAEAAGRHTASCQTGRSVPAETRGDGHDRYLGFRLCRSRARHTSPHHGDDGRLKSELRLVASTEPHAPPSPVASSTDGRNRNRRQFIPKAARLSSRAAFGCWLPRDRRDELAPFTGRRRPRLHFEPMKGRSGPISSPRRRIVNSALRRSR